MDFRCPQKGDNLIVAVSNRQLVTVRDPKFDLPNSDGDGTHLNRSREILTGDTHEKSFSCIYNTNKNRNGVLYGLSTFHYGIDFLWRC